MAIAQGITESWLPASSGESAVTQGIICSIPPTLCVSIACICNGVWCASRARLYLPNLIASK